MKVNANDKNESSMSSTAVADVNKRVNPKYKTSMSADPQEFIFVKKRGREYRLTKPGYRRQNDR